MSYLDAILARKEREVARRRRRARSWQGGSVDARRAERAYHALRKPPGALPRVIAEIKLRSPSAGEIRSRCAGEVPKLACDYVDAGAAAVSVLCDGPGFGGTPLDLRRAAGATDAPLLFKEFVLDELQIDLAACMGASMVLLLVRALQPARLEALVEAAHRKGLAPVVEAADDREFDVALQTSARIVGVNARDLRSFRVDGEAAARILGRLPEERIGVYMSGIVSAEDFRRVAMTRADAALIGEGLMRARSPGDKLRELTR